MDVVEAKKVKNRPITRLEQSDIDYNLQKLLHVVLAWTQRPRPARDATRFIVEPQQSLSNKCLMLVLAFEKKGQVVPYRAPRRSRRSRRGHVPACASFRRFRHAHRRRR